MASVDHSKVGGGEDYRVDRKQTGRVFESILARRVTIAVGVMKHCGAFSVPVGAAFNRRERCKNKCID